MKTMNLNLSSHAARVLLLLAAVGCSSAIDDQALDADSAMLDGSMLDGSRSMLDGSGSLADSGADSSADAGADSDAGDASMPTLILPVNLGSAGGFVVLAKTGISTVPPSAITGDIGVSPAAATYITGFALVPDASNAFATESLVQGKVYAADYAPPTPAKMTTAISDMQSAFTDASSRAPDFTELGAGDIGGETLEPGVYKWSTGLLIPTDMTLTGSDTAVWIFQIAEDLTVSNGTQVIMAGGALPKNVFWQVSGQVTLGTTSHLEGIVLSQTSITLGTGASINGRLLAQTAVDVDSSTITQPAP